MAFFGLFLLHTHAHTRTRVYIISCLHRVHSLVYYESCCCLIAFSLPVDLPDDVIADVVVVVWLCWLERVTCISPVLLGGEFVFRLGDVHRGGAALPNHPAGDAYLHRCCFSFVFSFSYHSLHLFFYFFFVFSLSGQDGIMC